MSEEKMTEEKSHYSKTELEEFRQIILKKLEEAREECKSLQANQRNSAEMSSESYNLTEYGTELNDKENNEMMISRTLKFIDSLERAMIRIENGSYGRCKVTGKLIPKERLRVVPHTETSIEGKMGPNR